MHIHHNRGQPRPSVEHFPLSLVFDDAGQISLLPKPSGSVLPVHIAGCCLGTLELPMTKKSFVRNVVLFLEEDRYLDARLEVRLCIVTELWMSERVVNLGKCHCHELRLMAR